MRLCPECHKSGCATFLKLRVCLSSFGLLDGKTRKDENRTVLLHCDAHAVEPDLKSRAAALDDAKVFDSLSRLTLYVAPALIKDFILLCFIPR